MTYTEDVVVDDKEDTETEKEGGDGETAVPVSEQEGGDDGKNEGVVHSYFYFLLLVLFGCRRFVPVYIGSIFLKASIRCLFLPLTLAGVCFCSY